MTDLASSLDSVAQVFGNGEERAAAEFLLRFLLSHPSTKHVNIGLVKELSGARRPSDKAVLRTLHFLAGESVGILSMKFEYLNDDEEPEDIDDDEARSAVQAGINPFTGEYDPECGRKLLIYFEPTGSLLP